MFQYSFTVLKCHNCNQRSKILQIFIFLWFLRVFYLVILQNKFLVFFTILVTTTKPQKQDHIIDLLFKSSNKLCTLIFASWPRNTSTDPPKNTRKVAHFQRQKKIKWKTKQKIILNLFSPIFV